MITIRSDLEWWNGWNDGNNYRPWQRRWLRQWQHQQRVIHAHSQLLLCEYSTVQPKDYCLLSLGSSHSGNHTVQQLQRSRNIWIRYMGRTKRSVFVRLLNSWTPDLLISKTPETSWESVSPCWQYQYCTVFVLQPYILGIRQHVSFKAAWDICTSTSSIDSELLWYMV